MAKDAVRTPTGYVEGALTGFSLASADLDVYTQLIGLEPFDSAEVTRNAEAMSRRVSVRRGTPASPADTFAFLLWQAGVKEFQP